MAGCHRMGSSSGGNAFSGRDINSTELEARNPLAGMQDP